MKNIHHSLFLFFLIACGSREQQNMQTTEQQPEIPAIAKGTFGYDLAFLKECTRFESLRDVPEPRPEPR